TAEGVVWLSINSSARGKEGALTPAEANNVITARSAAPTSLILDPSGAIGHLYEAKTTPHMFIIAKDGRLVYNGAIDSISSTSPDDISRAKNYVSAALDEVLAGKPVTVASSRPYGCSVHY
ncbi:MAG TPA: thioredoxin family protein, partial [Opitutaceae bacterium]|nr:thioredoxin family protein [Opitutaceae bacterium]